MTATIEPPPISAPRPPRVLTRLESILISRLKDMSAS